jgi:glycosyltransferase involved in cell wall biosynthesis
MNFDSLNILFVASYPASPATYGGQRRLEGLMSGLARRHRVSAIACASPDFDRDLCEREMRRYCEDVVLVPSRSEHFAKRWTQFRSLFSRYSAEKNFFTLSSFERALDRLLNRTAFDIIVVSAGLFMSRYRLRQAPPGSPLPRIILDEHNIEFDLQQQLATSGSLVRRLHYALNWRKLRREEVEDWERLDAVTFTSMPDAEHARELVPSLRYAVSPNAVDLSAFEPRQGDPPPDGKTVMFFGANDYYPNTDGILYFIREIWPRVTGRHPHARLKVIGPRPTPEILAQQSSSIRIAGMVADVRLELASAAAVVVPLRLGGGTRFKILEAMAMAKPIVSTSVGAEGLEVIDGKHLLLADDASRFADEVNRLLENNELGSRLGREGHALVKARYSWDASVAPMEALFREVLSLGQRDALSEPAPVMRVGGA